MSDSPATDPETPPPPGPPATPPVLPYSAAVHDVRRRGRKPTTTVPREFSVGSMGAGVAVCLVLYFLVPNALGDQCACVNVVVTPLMLTVAGGVAMLVWQMIVGWFRGDGFLCGSDDAYLVAGLAHGFVGTLAWWALTELMETSPSSPLAVKLGHAAAVFVVPLVAPVWMSRRPSAPGR